MSVVITGKYIGSLNVELKHEPSGTRLITDAPVDNGGLGSAFSPTDLIAAGLGSCILTTIGIVAKRSSLAVDGMHMRVEKHMGTEPRRISELVVAIHMPKGLETTDRQKLERAGLMCPVHKSLHPETEIRVEFLYDV
jgi:putative redox protein